MSAPGVQQVTQVSAAPLLASSLERIATLPLRRDRRSGVPSWLRLSLSNESSEDDDARSRGGPFSSSSGGPGDALAVPGRLSFARHRSLLSDNSDGPAPVRAVTRAVTNLLPSRAQEMEILPTVNPKAVGGGDKGAPLELFPSNGTLAPVDPTGEAGDPRLGLQAILDGKTKSPVGLFDLRRWLSRQGPSADLETWNKGLDFLLAYRAYALKFALLPPPTQAQSPAPLALIEQLSRARPGNAAARARAATLPSNPAPPPRANPFATPFDDEHSLPDLDVPVGVGDTPAGSRTPSYARPASGAPTVALEGFEFVTPPMPVASLPAPARGRAASDATTRFVNPRAAGLANTLQPRGVVSFKDLPDIERKGGGPGSIGGKGTRTSYMTSSSFVTGITETTVLPDNLQPDAQPLRRELDGFLSLWVTQDSPLASLGVSDDLVRRTRLEARYTTHPGVLRPVAERVLGSLNAHDGMLDAFLRSGWRNICASTATARLVWGAASVVLAVMITLLALLDPSPLSHGSRSAVSRPIRLIALPFWFVGLAYLVSALTRLCPMLGMVDRRERGSSARETLARQVDAHDARRSGLKPATQGAGSRFSVFSSLSAADDRARRSRTMRLRRFFGFATDTVFVPIPEQDPTTRRRVRLNLAIVVVGTLALQGAAVALPRIAAGAAR